VVAALLALYGFPSNNSKTGMPTMRIFLFLIALFLSGTACAQDKRLYSGTLNGKLKITVYLEGLETGTHADGILGSYQYAGKEAYLLLSGYSNNDGHICLTEMATPNFSGVFLGTIFKDRITGFWTSADGKKRYPFALVQVKAPPAEIARFEKGMEALGEEFRSY
jgi:hypothetical protein